MPTIEELRCLSAHFDAHLLRVVAILRAVAVFMVDGHHRQLQNCALLCGGRHIDVTRVVEQHERCHLVGTVKRELMEHVDDALLEGISLVVLRRSACHGGGFGIEMAESQERFAERNLVGEAAFVLSQDAPGGVVDIDAHVGECVAHIIAPPVILHNAFVDIAIPILSHLLDAERDALASAGLGFVFNGGLVVGIRHHADGRLGAELTADAASRVDLKRLEGIGQRDGVVGEARHEEKVIVVVGLDSRLLHLIADNEVAHTSTGDFARCHADSGRHSVSVYEVWEVFEFGFKLHRAEDAFSRCLTIGVAQEGLDEGGLHLGVGHTVEAFLSFWLSSVEAQFGVKHLLVEEAIPHLRIVLHHFARIEAQLGTHLIVVGGHLTQGKLVAADWNGTLNLNFWLHAEHLDIINQDVAALGIGTSVVDGKAEAVEVVSILVDEAEIHLLPDTDVTVGISRQFGAFGITGIAQDTSRAIRIERRGLAVFKSLNGEHHVGRTFIVTVWTAHPCRNEKTRGFTRHTSKVDRRNLTGKVGSVDIEEAALAGIIFFRAIFILVILLNGKEITTSISHIKTMGNSVISPRTL